MSVRPVIDIPRPHLSGDRVNPSIADIRNPATLRSRNGQADESIGRFSPRQGRAEIDDEDAARGGGDPAASWSCPGHATDGGGYRIQPGDDPAVSSRG